MRENPQANRGQFHDAAGARVAQNRTMAVASPTKNPEQAVTTQDSVARYPWTAAPAVRVVAMTAVVAAAVVLAAVLLTRPFEGTSTEITAGGGPVQSSPAELSALSDRLGHQIYWAGTAPGKYLEATLTASGLVFVRYLPARAPVGDPVPDYLTVGTYPDPSALSDLHRYARQTHAITRPVRGGGFAMVVRGAPRSVYVAYPGVPMQVEVYDPDRSHALSLIAAGMISPVP
jgi:hypothetical protein